MVIVTKQFSLGRRDYYRILLMEYFRRNWLVYVVILGFTVVEIFLHSTFLIIYGVAAAALLACYRAFSIYRYTGDSQNRNLFVTRRIEITADSVTVRSEDQGEDKFLFNSIVRAVRAKNHYRLYLAKNLFHYLPFDAFESEAERVGFDRLLVQAGMLRS
jgi:hypothetical protein